MTALVATLRRHWIAGLVGALALVGSTCFATAPQTPGQSPAGATTTDAGGDRLAAPPAITVPSMRAPAPAPDPGPALGNEGREPEPTATPSPLPEEVDEHQPDLVVRPETTPPDLSGVPGMEGVEHLARVAEFQAETPDGEGEDVELDAMAVDATTFRPMTPSVTAQEPGVWQRLSEGDVVLRHDVANRLDVELGGDIELSTGHATLAVRVGAFASNGAPPFADVIVPWEVASQLGRYGVTSLVVAVGDDHDERGVAHEIVDSVGGGEVEVLEAPGTQEASAERAAPTGTEALSRAESPGRVEAFSYTDLGDGMISIDGAWVDRWIAPVEIPGMGVTRCHRVMIPQLLGALGELQERGLYDHLDPAQFGGCWVPRHIDWRPDRPLSMHAWGLAIDFNVQTNGLGQVPTMDRRVVRVFERWGFEWGGWWSRPDGMHFELDRVLTR